MALTKEECVRLFKGYLLTDECPLRINLPRHLVFQLLNKTCLKDGEESIIDVTWYYAQEYQDHPFSLVNTLSRQQDYFEEYNRWRASISEAKNTEQLPDFDNFQSILDYAALKKQTVVIGESHNHSTPKAILLHNIKVLKQRNAIIFVESLNKELQDEFNKSVNKREATPIVAAYLRAKGRNEPSSYYTQRNLIKFCIQEGIPLIGCTTEACEEQSLENFIQLGECKQVAGISRMLQNYEHYKAIVYAKETFPDHTLHVCLVGDAHACAYHDLKSTETEFHPGIVDITDGLYVYAADAKARHSRDDGWILISKHLFFQEIEKVGKLTTSCYEKINLQLFSNNNVTYLNNIAPVLRAPSAETGLVLTEENLLIFLKNLYERYSRYMQINPAQVLTNITIQGYRSSVKSGYQILAKDEKEYTEKEGLLILFPTNVKALQEIITQLIDNIESKKAGRQTWFDNNTVSKVSKLQTILTWLNKQHDLDGHQEQIVIALVRDVCAIKRNSWGIFQPHSSSEFNQLLDLKNLKVDNQISFDNKELSQLQDYKIEELISSKITGALKRLQTHR